jgi:hypothetical protein
MSDGICHGRTAQAPVNGGQITQPSRPTTSASSRPASAAPQVEHPHPWRQPSLPEQPPLPVGPQPAAATRTGYPEPD